MSRRASRTGFQSSLLMAFPVLTATGARPAASPLMDSPLTPKDDDAVFHAAAVPATKGIDPTRTDRRSKDRSHVASRFHASDAAAQATTLFSSRCLLD